MEQSSNYYFLLRLPAAKHCDIIIKKESMNVLFHLIHNVLAKCNVSLLGILGKFNALSFMFVFVFNDYNS